MDENYEVKVKKNLRSICLLHLAFYVNIGFYAVNLGNFLVDLPGTTRFGLGVNSAVGMTVGMISVLVFGYYADKLSKKFSRKKIFFLASFCWIVGYGIRALSPHYYFFLFSTIISAFGAGAGFLPFGYAIIADTYPPDERGKKFGAMHMALLIGAAIGSIIGGIIIGGILGNLLGPIGWRYCYGIGFVLAMGTLIYYYFNGIDPERGRSDPELKDFEGEIEYDYKITLDSLIQILKKKTIKGLYLTHICGGFTGASLGT